MRRLAPSGRRRSTALLISVLIAGSSLVACSADDTATSTTTTTPTAPTTTPTAPTTTQSAPSVWSPLSTTPAASIDTDAATTSPVITPLTTPLGLSTACMGAIQAQRAVTDLFTAALQGRPPEEATSSTTAPTPTAKSTASMLAGITEDDVATTFDAIKTVVPPGLADAFATLHESAERIAGADLPTVPTVLAEQSTAAAMTQITEYISECAPVPTS